MGHYKHSIFGFLSLKFTKIYKVNLFVDPMGRGWGFISDLMCLAL